MYISFSEFMEKLNAKEREKNEDCKEIKALDFESVNRSSQAAAISFMVGFAARLRGHERKVEPLQREVEALEVATRDTREQVQRLEEEMAVLAESVERYKASYGVAVRAAEGLKADIEKGKERADRASRLVASLRDEQERWSTEAEERFLLRQLPGQCLRDAVDVAYNGPRSEKRRQLREVCGASGPSGLSVDDKDLTSSVSQTTLRRYHDRHGLPRIPGAH